MRNNRLIQLSAPSGNTIYAMALLLGNRVITVGGAQALDASQWAAYALAVSEPVAGTGKYFLDLSALTLSATTILLPFYVQIGNAPASTDPLLGSAGGQGGFTLIAEVGNNQIKTISPLASVPGVHLIDLPQPQSSTRTAQEILGELYKARLELAQSGMVSVTIEGQQTVFQSAGQLDKTIREWERRVAFLTGQRRRVSRINLSGF